MKDCLIRLETRCGCTKWGTDQQGPPRRVIIQPLVTRLSIEQDPAMHQAPTRRFEYYTKEETVAAMIYVYREEGM